MQFSGTEMIIASPEQIFDLLTDPHQIAECAPLMEEVNIRSDEEFEFNLSASGFKVGFTVRWTEKQRPNLAHSVVEGGSRMMGRATLQNELHINGDGAGSSRVDWSSDATVTGMIGRMVDEDQLRDIVTKLNVDVIDCVRQKLE